MIWTLNWRNQFNFRTWSSTTIIICNLYMIMHRCLRSWYLIFVINELVWERDKVCDTRTEKQVLNLGKGNYQTWLVRNDLLLFKDNQGFICVTNTISGLSLFFFFKFVQILSGFYIREKIIYNWEPIWHSDLSIFVLNFSFKPWWIILVDRIYRFQRADIHLQRFKGWQMS